MTLGLDGTSYRAQLKAIKSNSSINSLNGSLLEGLRNSGSDSMFDSIVSQIYNPMNIAIIICRKFKNHPDALISAFIDDMAMFEYMYEFLPKDITVGVLNQIPLEDSIKIVQSYQTSAFVYDQIDPILYVVRFFSDSKIGDQMSKDPYCAEFNKNMIPNGSILDFVLRCKNYLSKNEFETLVKMVCV